MSLVLTIDIGNTAAKGSLFDDWKRVSSKVVDNDDPDSLVRKASEYNVEGAVICNVTGSDPDFANRLRAEMDIPVVELTSTTPLPFEVCYRTPSTLGVDRVAAAAGAIHKYGGDVLIVDAGTAVTMDIVSEGRYLGGNISPGLRLRFRSLHAFTGKLPLIRPDGAMPQRGQDTETAIRCGVVGGLVAEIFGTYHEERKRFNDLKLVMTGGDADFLAPLLKEKGLDSTIDHDLVGIGLLSIYNYNKK
ncbi:MAG: type III pantothenate kinase [Muribaculaceae bacterium]|nr:type III pantothenate kinase [Muribaculaceae bacterium]